ncbi:MAG: LysR family transcriptional regulator [Pseudomonadales bacterium]|nr:LysR family transcriptional regulator [Pseudomonadales bacterium]
MHIGRVDLNLYVVFDAIYSEGSITRAAAKLNLTQPAVSHALSRLREVYGDPLFVRSGNRMNPSPVARSIVQPVRDALQELQGTLTAPLAFDPTVAQKQVTLSMRDVVESVLLPELVVQLEGPAPLMQVTSVRTQRREMEAELASGRLDLAFDVLLPVGPAIRHQVLMEDEFVVVSRKRHPLLKGGLDMKKYLALRHVIVSSRRSGPAVEDFELGRLGYHRNIGMRCQNYFVAWKTIAGSNMLLTVPQNYALRNQTYHNLKIWPMPAELRPLASYMYWHESVDDDPANVWLRQQILELNQSLFAG